MPAGLWPLVGREVEMSTLLSVFDGKSRGFIISGSAGVGKTRLLRELTAQRVAAGEEVEWIGATLASQGISLAAVTHLLQPSLGVTQLHELLRGALDALQQRWESKAFSIIVDDAHLLDNASATLLHLVASRTIVPLFVGIRAEDPAPDVLVRLWKDGWLSRVDIGPLDESSTQKLLETVVPELRPHTASRLWMLSRGNPLFLTELVAMARESASKEQLGSTLLVATDPAGPTRLNELIDARIGRLSPDLFDSLEVVAAGEPLPLALAERLSPGESLADLERRCLIVLSSSGEVRTAHPLYGESLRSKMGPLRYRSVLRRLADAAQPSDGLDRKQLATWRLKTGDEDPGLFISAARDALRWLDYSLAEELARAAILGATAEQAIHAGLALAEALMGEENPQAAEDVLQNLRPVDDEGRARVATTRAINLFRGMSQQDASVVLLESAEIDISDAAWRAECRSVRSMILAVCLRLDEALALSAPLIDDPDAREPARVRAVFAASTTWMHRGETERVLALTSRWLELTRAWRRYAPLVEVQLGFIRFYALLLVGRLDEARTYAESGFDFGQSHAMPALRAIFAMARGAAAVAQGRGADAVISLEEAEESLSGSDWFYNQEFLRRSLLVRALLLVGELDKARQIAGTTDDAVAGTEIVNLYERPAAKAWLDVAEGRVAAAINRLVDAAENARGRSLCAALSMYHDAARLDQTDAFIEPLEVLAGQLDNEFAWTALEHAKALAARDGDGLVNAASTFENLGALLLSAETFAQAASAYSAVGKHGSALGADSRCEELLGRCGQPRSDVIRILGTEEARPLTRREREIALLAAHGHSNAELADELHLSINTVHTHLTRIYRKLGVVSREDLASQFGLEQK